MATRRPKRRRGGAPKFTSTTSERDFRRALRKRLRALRELLDEHAHKAFDAQRARTDAWRYDAGDEEWTAMMRELWVRISGEPTDAANAVVEKIDRSTNRTVQATIADVVPDARVIPESIDLSATTNEIAERIKRLEGYYIEQVSEGLRDVAQSQGSQADLRDMLREKAGLSNRHAELLARDVVGTLHAELAAARSKDAGLNTYVWRTMRDERVRPEHRAREGKTFSWDDPPDDGHPGEAPSCRCFAASDIEGLLADLLLSD